MHEWSAVDIIARALYERSNPDRPWDALSDERKVDCRNEAAGLLHEIGLHEVADQMEADARLSVSRERGVA